MGLPPPPGSSTPSDGGAPFLVGVAGGTGSGKTTVAATLADAVGADRVGRVALDAYYRDRSELDPEQRRTIDYDHPDAFDWPLLFGHLADLRQGRSVEVPVYDYARHVRTAGSQSVAPTPVIVVEGILVLHPPGLRDLFDLKVFVDADADVRFIRRLQRDVRERGRTPEGVIEQYLATVRPAHLEFVEPTKKYADVIVPHGGRNHSAVDVLIARMRELSGGPAGARPGPAATARTSPTT